MSEMSVSVLADPDIAAALQEADAIRPDEPSLPIGQWMKKNLFSSVFNSILTVIFSLLALFTYQGVLNFVFSENTRWDAVRVNLRLLFTQAYPTENYTRIWVALGFVLVLTGLSIGTARVGQGISMKKIATWFFAGGLFITIGVLLREPSVLTDADGATRLDDDLQVMRESFGEAMGNRIGWWAIGLISLAIGSAIWFGLGDLRRRTTFVPAVPFGLGVIGLLVSSVWWYNWGHYAFTDDGFVFEPGRKVVSSTQVPWTILFLLLVGTYLVSRMSQGTDYSSKIKMITNIGWLLSPFITYWAILRAPIVDWSHVVSTDLPLFILFGLGGAALLWVITKPGIGEVGRLIAIAIVFIALFTWVGAFFGWFSMLQKVRFSILF